MGAVVGPRRAERFLDRSDPRREIREIVEERQTGGQVCLIFIHGHEGIGRSALVSEIFHEDPARFGGVYIEINALQPDGTPTSQGEMLGQALISLGLPENQLPVSDAARRIALQRVSAGRRFMMHVREAVTAEQAVGLIPRGAPEAVVIVTTRVMLRPLITEGFADIPLGELPPADTRELLADRLGPAAGKIPTDMLHELADECGGFPLLVRLVAAHLARRPHIAGRALAELRAVEPAAPGENALRRMTRFLDPAYESLDGLQVAYRMLALVPGPSFGADVAAVALGSDRSRAERQAEDLVDSNMLKYDDESARYSFYRIVRQDALRRAYEVDKPDWCRSRISRIVDWYLKQAIPRDAALGGRWRVGPAFEEYSASNAHPPSRVDALTWWRAEWRSLVDCVDVAHRNGLHDIAWQLCVALFKYLHMNGHHEPWLRTHDRGVESAEAAGHDSGLMQLLNQRGGVRLALGDLDAATADFNRSYELAVQVGHLAGEQSALEWLGKIAVARRHIVRGMEYYDRSQAVVERAGAALGVEQRARMLALLDLHRSRAWIAEAAWDQASAAAERAEAYFASAGETENQAKALLVLGAAGMGRGDVAGAVERYERAVALFDEDGALRSSANARRSLGGALATAGRQADAIAVYRQAQQAFDRLGDDAADDMAEEVAKLSR